MAWSGYAIIAEQPAPSGGRQRFLVSYPLRTCRACANLATLRVVYRFDAGGRYQGYALLAPGPPS